MLDKAKNWIRFSMTSKLISLGAVALLLSIPAALISVLISERSRLADDATTEVSAKWGNAQVITGPMLVVPFRELQRTATGELASNTRHAYFLPESLSVNGELIPSVRYQGIYEVMVYTSALAFSGQFVPPNFADWEIDTETILWSEAALIMGIEDMRGINETITLSWNDAQTAFSGGIEAKGVVSSGISANIDVADGGTFSFELSLNGSQSLMIVPAGKTTSMSLASSWPSPKFDGAFLPDEREVDTAGFSAQWHVLDLNRPYPQKFRGTTQGVEESAFGVSLVLPVDHYRRAMRASRYAFIVIFLTLLTFFLVEVRNQKHAHPFQYILVGLMLCLFYTLLLSISEHVSFNSAYAIAGAAVITTIALYMQSVYHEHTLTLLTGGVLIAIYLFMYLLLQLEDHALLVGSIGAFIAVALTMYLTRNVEWYRRGDEALESS